MLTIIQGFRRSENGMAAVEFAFILPVLLILFFGVVEVSSALSARAGVNNVSSTSADLVAQASNISDADMQNVFAAASAILYPNPLSNSAGTSLLKIVVTSVIDTGSATSGKVAWSDSSTGTGAYSKNATYTLPTGLMTSGGSVIVAEVTYDYGSPTSQMVAGAITMKQIFYTKPRRVAAITRG